MLPKKDIGIVGQYFSVLGKPYCVWMAKDSNLHFLKNLDTDYFWYLADTHSKQLNGEHKLRSAISLKLAYYQGIEAFFMLLFSSFFSPKSVCGWLLKCRTEQVRDILQSVKDGVAPKYLQIELDTWSWLSISRFVTGTIFGNTENKDQLIGWFSEMWKKFADDFCEQHAIDEYNGIKHGLRVNAGKGPSFKISPPENNSDGRQPTVLSSDFGINFFSQKKILNSEGSELGHHFVLQSCHVNIDPTYLAHWVCMVSMSIKNVVALLFYLNDYPMDNLFTLKPADENTLKLLKPKTNELLHCSFSPDLYTKDVMHITKEKILNGISKPRWREKRA